MEVKCNKLFKRGLLQGPWAPSILHDLPPLVEMPTELLEPSANILEIPLTVPPPPPQLSQARVSLMLYFFQVDIWGWLQMC